MPYQNHKEFIIDIIRNNGVCPRVKYLGYDINQNIRIRGCLEGSECLVEQCLVLREIKEYKELKSKVG